MAWIATMIAAAIGIALSMGHPGATSAGVPPSSRSTARGPVTDETMAWRPVAIGGGGFVTGLAWDARGVTRLARTDVYGAYRWDTATDRWQQVVTAESMPPTFRRQDGIADGVYEIAVAPGDPNRVYMATHGSVFRSDDGGRHWRLPPAPTAFRFNANGPFRLGGPYMAVSPADPDLVLIGTPEQGLWRSRDGALTWQPVGDVPRSQPEDAAKPGARPGILLWFPDPAGRRIWAASSGGGLFRSDDGGDHFQLVTSTGPRSIRRGVFRRDGTFLAADYNGKRLWRFAGGAWSEMGTDTLPVSAWQTIAIDPRSDTMLAGDAGGKLWCSIDSGRRWSKVTRDLTPGPGEPPWLRLLNLGFVATAQIAFDPVDPTRLWSAAGSGVYTAAAGQPCDPVHWQSRTRGIEEIVANDAVSAPGIAPVFAGWDFGIHVKPALDTYSTTYGPRQRVLIAAQQVDWTPARRGFLVTNASDTRMGCCSEDGQSVLAGYSEDGGTSWTRFATLPTPPGTKPDDPWRMSFGTIAVAANDPDNIVWEPAFNRSPYYTKDRGRTWQRVVLPGETGTLTGSFGAYYLARKTLAADRVRPATFYLLHSGGAAQPGLAGLWTTIDGGATWTRAFVGEVVPASGFSAKLRAVPGHAGHLFLTSGVADAADTRLRRSTDGGRNWATLDALTHIDDIGFGKAAVGASYPTIFVSGQVSGVYGIWRSVDAGQTWHRLVDFPRGTLDQVTVVEGDKDVFGRVYIGYKGSGWIYGEPAPCPATLAEGSEQCTRVH